MDARMRPRRLLFCAAGIALTAALASACGGGGRAAQAADPPQLVAYRGSELSFRHPGTWKAYPFRWAGGLHFQPMVYVSTQPVEDPCRTKGTTTMCAWPIRRLQPGGVLIAWENRGFPGWSLRTQPGANIRVGGRSAKFLATRPGACSAIGGNLTIEVAIASPLPDNWTEVTACLRGPHLAQSERSVDALLASTQFLSQ
jgi:hypothetical protein